MSTNSEALFEACHALSERPHKTVESTETCKKRASVAVIVAWHEPTPSSSPSSSWINVDSSTSQQGKDPAATSIKTLEELEEQEWVNRAVPHILFIKRAARDGDRWASHVALPGGMRESNESDEDAARRETEEEVGLKLDENHCIYVGGLDQRMVTTSFGTRELLILCPYVFIWTKPGLPLPVAQQSEVHSAHWVSIPNLLDPASRTTEAVDISSRLARSYAPDSIFASCIRFVTGQMLFSAISMTATQSVLATPTSPAKSSNDALPVGQDDFITDISDSPLIMWGLTLAVMTDFLDMLPPHTAISLWSYPTFSAPDLAIFLKWLNTPSRKQTKLRTAKVQSERAQRRAERRAARKLKRAEKKKETDAVNAQNIVDAIDSQDYVGVAMLDFYAKIRPAIGLTIGFRAGVLGIGLLIAARVYRRL